MDVDVNLILNQILPAKLISLLNQSGNVQAARAAADHLQRLQDALAVDQHRQAVEELDSDPSGLAEYYGRLELPKRELRLALGVRELAREEHDAYQRGRQARAAEIRALELHRAKRGQRVEPWMTRC